MKKRLKKNASFVLSREAIERHKYKEGIVELSLDLVAGCGLSLHSAVKVLNCLDSRFHLDLQEKPCPNSIKNWVKKAGYSVYGNPRLKEGNSSYCEIIDESMMIGSEKLLLSLGVKAGKTESSCLSLPDVEILDISIAKSWSGAGITERLDATGKKLGRAPAYVISDNASIMNKGIRDSSLIHIRDVGHTLAMFLERQYSGTPAFMSFMKDLAKTKNREVMRPVSYLLPPKQRIIARFMNLAPCLKWANRMLKVLKELTGEEQRTFSFLKKHTGFIKELSGIVFAFERISKRMKEEGLSRNTVEACTEELLPLTESKHSRVRSAAKECLKYLEEESGKLSSEDSVWHISSDVLESIFGVYKERKSPNALNGVTGYILLLPVLTKINPESGCFSLNVKDILENVFLRDIDTWEKDNLSENLAVKRRKTFEAA